MENEMVSIKAVQAELFDLLKVVARICEENGLNYWLDGGTLLGARRQGGFIPWDDDLDVALPYADFLQLQPKLKEFCLENQEYVIYGGFRPVPYWSEYFGKVTLLKDGLLPVEIDLIYVKDVTDDVQSLAEDERTVNLARSYIYGKSKNTKLKLKVGDFTAKSRFFNHFIGEYLRERGKLTVGGKLNYAFNDMLVKKERPYYQHAQIFPLGRITFHGQEFNCPHQIDEYLSVLYGKDFLTPPPLNQRNPSVTTYLKNRLPLQRVERWMRWLLELDAKFYRARGSSNKWKRRLLKLPHTGRVIGRAIANGDMLFLSRFFRQIFQ